MIAKIFIWISIFVLIDFFVNGSHVNDVDFQRLVEDVAKLKEINAKMEDDIENRVAKLEQLAKIGTLRTCQEYARFGLASDGVYLIDPDGPLLGHEPFNVFCNFTSGATEIYHNSESVVQVEHCHDPGCYNKTITYTDGENFNEMKPVPASQILALIELSSACSQSFSYDCLLAPLTSEDVDYAYWTDRHGDVYNYYTGQNQGSHVCDCTFAEDGCAEEDTKHNRCNCDANLPVMLKDTGVITNSTALPITQLFFGGLQYEAQQASFQLGRLKCYGEADVKTGTSCSALKMSGIFNSGHYVIKEEGDVNKKTVYCGMDTSSYDNVEQTEETELSAMTPIGTIIAWIPKITPDGNLLPLPTGWLFCNGTEITEGPWKGSFTPQLNNLFLRGGDEETVLETQSSQLQDHQHDDPGHSHGCSASSTSGSHHHTYRTGKVAHEGGSGENYVSDANVDNNLDDASKYITADTGSVSVSVSTTCTLDTEGSNLGGVDSNTAESGQETRPANMKVIYIMRVY